MVRSSRVGQDSSKYNSGQVIEIVRNRRIGQDIVLTIIPTRI